MLATASAPAWAACSALVYVSVILRLGAPVSDDGVCNGALVHCLHRISRGAAVDNQEVS